MKNMRKVWSDWTGDNTELNNKKKRSNSKREELEIKFLNFISIDILFHFDKYFIFLIKIECFSFKIF